MSSCGFDKLKERCALPQGLSELDRWANRSIKHPDHRYSKPLVVTPSPEARTLHTQTNHHASRTLSLAARTVPIPNTSTRPLLPKLTYLFTYRQYQANDEVPTHANQLFDAIHAHQCSPPPPMVSSGTT